MGKRRALALPHAIALGLLHGPAELLPISSSAHTSLVPWFAGWPYGELDPELRKSFEVALHAGTAAALLLRPPSARPSLLPHPLLARPSSNTGGDDPLTVDPEIPSRSPLGPKLTFLAGALTPPAFAGYTLGGHIERRLGTPTTIASGLLVGSVAMGVVEAYVYKGRSTRTLGWRDGLALGLAQSLALFPGVSRSGATLTAARARGFTHLDADRLSWHTGLPVIAGAAMLKGSQLARAGIPRDMRLPLAAGAASALLSTLAGATVLTPKRRVRLLPVCAAYRGILALLVIRRMRDNTGQHAPTIKKIKRSHSPPARKGILRRSRLKS